MGFGPWGFKSLRPHRIRNLGAVAQLAKAPVSKTGDSRFESWLPRSSASIIAGVRRALAIAVACVVLSVPAAAGGAVRYAAPGGGTVVGCERTTPCSLEYAITAAAPNDEVVVAHGLHEVTATIVASVPLAIRGETNDDTPTLDGRRPQIVGAPTVTPLESTARLVASDLRISSYASPSGALVAVGNASVFERLELLATGEDTSALRPGVGFTLTNSMLRTDGKFSSALFLQGTESGAGVVRNSTLIGTGPESSGLALYVALSTATITLQAVNVIADAATDVNVSATPGGNGSVVLDHSNFDTSKGSVTGTGNQTAPPVFVDAAGGDFHQRIGPPTVDAGLNDPANGTTDLEGQPRAFGGPNVFPTCGGTASPPVTDIGAYEEIYAIAVPMIGCPRPRARPDTRITAAKIRKPVGRAKFRFRAIGPRTGFQCKLTTATPKTGKRAGPKRWRRCSSPKAYRNLGPGRYHFAVRAISGGAVDRTPAKRRFRIP